jgi:hypothetical protein
MTIRLFYMFSKIYSMYEQTKRKTHLRPYKTLQFNIIKRHTTLQTVYIFTLILYLHTRR